MALALDLARLAEGRTSPNPAVGAVIVRQGKILVTGFHRGPGKPHAEIEAMRKIVGVPLGAPQHGAQQAAPLHAATLYVTLEPCCPPKVGGRTPPCTDAIIQSGISEVVVGIRDPDPGIAGRGIRELRRHKIRVREKILRRECEEFYQAYITHRKKKRPFVTLKAAVTRDGMVASKTGSPRWITGDNARAMVHQMRDRVDAVLVGIGTVEKDDPQLTTRLSGGHGQDPVRVVLDSRLRIGRKAHVLTLHSPSPTWIATTVSPSSSRVRKIRKRGVEVLFCRKDDRLGRVDLKDLLKKLACRGIVTLLVEGGPNVWRSFLEAGLVDQVALFIAPFRLGKKGVPFSPR